MKSTGIWHMVIGLVSVAIAFVMFPIVLDGVSAITGHTNIAVFTGLSSVANIAPLIIFVGLLFGGGAGVYSGYKKLT